LQDRTEQLALFGFPGLAEPPDAAGAAVSVPSNLGRGVDLLAPADDHDRLVETLERTYQPAGHEDVEAWRVRAGIPRFGVDGTPDDLPQECGFERDVAFGKGCYLGQEAMAKVRNLGHPRRVLVRLDAADAVAPGEPVTARGREVGEITSAARFGIRTVALARVAWDAREGPFVTSRGSVLSVPAVALRDQARAK
jgi:folate-binding protein YgfZ